MRPIHLSTLAVAASVALFSACSSSPTRPVDDRYGQVQAQSTQYGIVRSIEVVPASSRSTSGAGAVLGAVIGAAVGNQIGSGTGRAAATGVGAVGGAVLGNQIEKRRADDVYRVSVRFDDGSTQAFNFDRIDALRVGDRVLYDGRDLRLV